MHFWRLTPAEYRALTVAEFVAMGDYMSEHAASFNDAVEGG